MGMNIGFYRIVRKHPRGWLETKSANDAPEYFTYRFPRIMAYCHTILDVPHEYLKTCSCGEKCSYGCGGDAVYRPTDFAAFRAQLKAGGFFGDVFYGEDGEEDVFKEITDWLEAHPDVYVEIS